MERRETLTRLRASLDSNDVFVSGGHGVISTAGATRHADRMKTVPVWALDDLKIKQFIDTRFPKTKTNPEQRRLARRMVLLIHLYYRVGLTMSAVAEELRMTPNAVKCVLSRISYQMTRSLKPSHRPKKGDPIDATNGTNGDDSRISL